jgi:hypothetical protein
MDKIFSVHFFFIDFNTPLSAAWEKIYLFLSVDLQ